MAVINTNVKALFSQAALKLTGRSQEVAMQQLSTGKRINSSRDDAEKNLEKSPFIVTLYRPIYCDQ